MRVYKIRHTPNSICVYNINININKKKREKFPLIILIFFININKKKLLHFFFVILRRVKQVRAQKKKGERERWIEGNPHYAKSHIRIERVRL